MTKHSGKSSSKRKAKKLKGMMREVEYHRQKTDLKQKLAEKQVKIWAMVVTRLIETFVGAIGTDLVKLNGLADAVEDSLEEGTFNSVIRAYTESDQSLQILTNPATTLGANFVDIVLKTHRENVEREIITRPVDNVRKKHRAQRTRGRGHSETEPESAAPSPRTQTPQSAAQPVFAWPPLSQVPYPQPYFYPPSNAPTLRPDFRPCAAAQWAWPPPPTVHSPALQAAGPLGGGQGGEGPAPAAAANPPGPAARQQQQRSKLAESSSGDDESEQETPDLKPAVPFRAPELQRVDSVVQKLNRGIEHVLPIFDGMQQQEVARTEFEKSMDELEQQTKTIRVC